MAELTIESFPCTPTRPPWRGGCVASSTPAVLPEILRPDLVLAIWHRPIPLALHKLLGPLAAAAPFSCSVEAPPADAIAQLATLLPAAAPLDLLRDIHELATLFASLVDSDAVRLRLDGVTGRACHRWHADAVGLRLLTTYRGAGTDWLPAAGGAARARRLAPGALPARPQRLPAGAVGLFKGEGFAGNADWGCIHRSPPPDGIPRLLLCIDEPGRIPLDERD